MYFIRLLSLEQKYKMCIDYLDFIRGMGIYEKVMYCFINCGEFVFCFK